MGRSFVLAFLGKTRMKEEKFHHVHESPLSISGVLIVLAIASLVVGWFNIPKGLIPLGSLNSLFHHFLEPVTDRGALLVAQELYGYTGGTAPYGAIVVGQLMKDGALYADYHGPELLLAIVSVIIALIGLGFAYYLYGSGSLEKAKPLSTGVLKPIWSISFNAWKWDDFYNALFVGGSWRLCEAALWFDRNIVDGIVNGIGAVARRFGVELRRLHSGQVQVYALVMFIGVCVFLLYFALGLSTFLGNAAPSVEPVAMTTTR
jgi:NADH:ubiquinone oxidoreductase subunit 5 (subunit L)/multisubunit Na+/H+ antiporter MnhA subunit